MASCAKATDSSKASWGIICPGAYALPFPSRNGRFTYVRALYSSAAIGLPRFDDRGQPGLDALARLAIGGDVLGLEQPVGEILFVACERERLVHRQFLAFRVGALDVLGQLELAHRGHVAAAAGLRVRRRIGAAALLDAIPLLGGVERMGLLALLLGDESDLVEGDDLVALRLPRLDDRDASRFLHRDGVQEREHADHPGVALAVVVVGGLVPLLDIDRLAVKFGHVLLLPGEVRELEDSEAVVAEPERADT